MRGAPPEPGRQESSSRSTAGPTLWERSAIAEGVALLTASLSRASIGPYQVQAAIAAVHDEAASAEDADWAQILGLYGLLQRMSDNPMVTLNHAIALAMVHGRLRDWSGSTRSPRTRACRVIIASTRCVRISWSGRATTRARSRTTGAQRSGRRARRSGTTF